MGLPHPLLVPLVGGERVGAIEEGMPLVRSAVEHRVSGMLWTEVEQGSADLEGTARNALFQADVASWGQNTTLWKSLEAIVSLLREMGIEFYAFKGVAVEHQWYRRLGERPSSDLDLVVAPHHAHRMGEVLRAVRPDHILADHVDELVSSSRLQSVAFWLDDGVALDLHIDPLKLGFPLRLAEWMWEHTRFIEGPGGIRLRAPDEDAALVQALVHANRDRFRQLRAHADVYRILQAGVDWPEVEEAVRREGLQTIVWSSLEAIAADLGADWGAPSPPDGWRSRLWRALWSPEMRLQGEVARFRYGRRSQFVIPLLCHGRAPESIRGIARRLFPPEVLVRYHHGNEGGRYLSRLVRGRLERVSERRESLEKARSETGQQS